MNDPNNPNPTRTRRTPLLLGSILAFSVFAALVPTASAAATNGLCSVVYDNGTTPIVAGTSFGNNAPIVSFEVNASLAIGDKLQMVFPAGTSFDSALANTDLTIRQAKNAADPGCQDSAGAGTPVSASPSLLLKSGSGGATPTLTATVANARADGFGPVDVKIGSAGLITHPLSVSASHNFTLSILTAANAVKMGPVSANVTVQVEASAATSTIDPVPAAIANSNSAQSIIWVHGKDAAGSAISVSGANVCLSTDAGTLSSVAGANGTVCPSDQVLADDSHNGTYHATLTGDVTLANATITGRINGTVIAHTGLVEFVGSYDEAMSYISASPLVRLADNTQTSTVSVQLQDAFGHDLLATSPDATVCLTSSLSGSTFPTAGSCGAGKGLAAHVASSRGLYQTTIKSSADGVALINASVAGDAMDNGGIFIESVNVTFTKVPSGLHTQIDASPSSIAANGASTSTITVTAKTSGDVDVGAGGATVTLQTDRGTLSAVTDLAPGTPGQYQATLTSDFSNGTATITGTINGESIVDNATVVFTALPRLEHNATHAPSSSVGGASNVAYTFGFQTNSSVQWGKGQGLAVVFPSGYGFGSVSAQTDVGGPVDHVDVDSANKTVYVWRCQGSSPCLGISGGDWVNVTLTGITNKASGSSGKFELRQLAHNGDAVANGTAPAVTLTSSGDTGPTPTSADYDGDGVPNFQDNCPTVSNSGAGQSADADHDGFGDACDQTSLLSPKKDPDQDGIVGRADNCPTVYNPDQAHVEDGDAAGDACDDVNGTAPRSDPDQDGVLGRADNCPRAYNPDQSNLDGDRAGDWCDTDADGDRVSDLADNCHGYYNPGQRNLDKLSEGSGPFKGDACDSDMDGDGILNGVDPCPTVDGTCSPGDYLSGVDRDQDGIPNLVDNCPSALNTNQANWDNDRQGDACDRDDDNDGRADTSVREHDQFSLLPGYDGWI